MLGQAARHVAQQAAIDRTVVLEGGAARHTLAVDVMVGRDADARKADHDDAPFKASSDIRPMRTLLHPMQTPHVNMMRSM